MNHTLAIAQHHLSDTDGLQQLGDRHYSTSSPLADRVCQLGSAPEGALQNPAQRVKHSMAPKFHRVSNLTNQPNPKHHGQPVTQDVWNDEDGISSYRLEKCRLTQFSGYCRLSIHSILKGTQSTPALAFVKWHLTRASLKTYIFMP